MKTNESFINLLTEIEEDNKLTVIDYSEAYETILAQDKKTGKAHYIYNVSDDMSFNFSLLCEVGASWLKSFKRLLADNNLKAVTCDTDPTDYYETLQRIK